jgi:hypothetical protein
LSLRLGSLLGLRCLFGLRRGLGQGNRLDGFGLGYRLWKALDRSRFGSRFGMIALLLFVLVAIGLGFIWKVGIYVYLGKMQPHGKLIIVPAHVVQILIVFQVIL